MYSRPTDVNIVYSAYKTSQNTYFFLLLFVSLDFARATSPSHLV